MNTATINDYLSYIQRLNRSRLTVIKYRQVLEDFNALIPLSAILTERDLDRYVDLRKDLKPASLRCSLLILRRFMSWAARRAYIPASPMADYELPRFTRHVRIPLTFDQQVAILAYDKQARYTREDTQAWHNRLDRTQLRNCAMWHILLLCGLRINEACNLRVMDVCEQSVTVRGKGERVRSVPMLPRCWHAITRWLSGLHSILNRPAIPSDWLFPTQDLTRPAPTNTFRSQFTLMCRDLKIKDACLHSCRHTYAYTLLRAGVSVRTIADLLGHADLGTTMIYLTLWPGDLSADVARHPLANLDA